ncbi:MAG: TadE family protein [Patescibacteria group bacterium]|nr:TadE family protein [Patescibacteria group bacterium]
MTHPTGKPDLRRGPRGRPRYCLRGGLRGACRRGLSTLELVMALPILLMIMALMVNYGVVASWKIRALAVSRHAVWSTRWPRSAGGDPRPARWPETAPLGTNGLDRWAVLDDARVHHRVARGSLAPWANVNESLLDPARGPREGTADIERGYPMLGRMGTYRLHASNPLLDDLWQYQRMGLSSNRQRRIPVIYELAQAPASYSQAYVQSVMAILNNPNRAALQPLDQDDEFLGYSARFGWGSGAPDFHPRLSQFCSLDHEIAQERVDDLIERIAGHVEYDAEGNEIGRTPGLPNRMTQAWIGLYRRVIDSLQALIDAQPPPLPGAGAAMQAEIDQLERQIEVLQEYLESL